MKGCYIAFCLVVVLAVSSTGHAGKEFDNLVKVSAKATKPGADGKQLVTFTFAIEKGWYIYANPVGAKDYEDNRTRIAVSAKEKVVADVQYPATDRTNEHKHKIYQNEVAITTKVQRTAGDTSPLQAQIEINVCNKSTCLPTRTIKLTIR